MLTEFWARQRPNNRLMWDQPDDADASTPTPVSGKPSETATSHHGPSAEKGERKGNKTSVLRQKKGRGEDDSPPSQAPPSY